LFFMDEVDELLLQENIAVDLTSLKTSWKDYVSLILEQATIKIPDHSWQQAGGRKGIHSEHLGYLLAEMQYMQRAYPGMEW